MDLKNKYDPFSRFDTGKFDTGGFSNLSNQYDPFAKWDKPKKICQGKILIRPPNRTKPSSLIVLLINPWQSQHFLQQTCLLAVNQVSIQQ